MRTISLSSTTAPMTVLGAALLLAAFAAWQDFTRLQAYRRPPPGSTGQSTAPDSAPSGQAVEMNKRLALPEGNLFGALTQPAREDAGQGARPVPAPVDDAALPASTAAYRLFGLIDAAAERDRRVVIGTGEADQRELAVGDEAPDGARVHAIRARAVILDRAGVLERLDLPVQTDDSMSGLTAAPTAVTAPSPALPGAFNPASLPATAPAAATRPDDEPHSD